MTKHSKFPPSFLEAIKSRHQPIYDNTFDDLLKKLDGIEMPITSSLRTPKKR